MIETLRPDGPGAELRRPRELGLPGCRGAGAGRGRADGPGRGARRRARHRQPSSSPTAAASSTAPLATANTLPEVVAAVKGSGTILVDGGLRHRATWRSASPSAPTLCWSVIPALWGFAAGGEARSTPRAEAAARRAEAPLRPLWLRLAELARPAPTWAEHPRRPYIGRRCPPPRRSNGAERFPATIAEPRSRMVRCFRTAYGNIGSSISTRSVAASSPSA